MELGGYAEFSRLTETLEVNTLLNEVSGPKEAVLDAQRLVWLSELGKVKANQMCSKSLDLAPFLEVLSCLRLSLSPDDNFWNNTGQDW